jgi:hypothetical protein
MKEIATDFVLFKKKEGQKYLLFSDGMRERERESRGAGDSERLFFRKGQSTTVSRNFLKDIFLCYNILQFVCPRLLTNASLHASNNKDEGIVIYVLMRILEQTN